MGLKVSIFVIIVSIDPIFFDSEMFPTTDLVCGGFTARLDLQYESSNKRQAILIQAFCRVDNNFNKSYESLVIVHVLCSVGEQSLQIVYKEARRPLQGKAA